VPHAVERGFNLADPYAIGVLFAGLVLFAAVVALTKERERAFTSAVVYLLLGALAAAGLELLGVDLFDPFADAEVMERLSEFAVIIALFGAGLRIDRALGWSSWRTPALLLGVVMPLTIAAITLWGVSVMGLSLGAAILLGAVLAPTDPVLASDVQVGPPGDSDEPEPNFALTVEAGGNDGLAFPFVFLGLFVAAEGGTDWLAEWVLADVLYGIAAGCAIGIVAGNLLARFSTILRHRELIAKRFDGWLAIASVLVVYGLTELVGAYGFLAAFTAGLAFRRHEATHESHTRVHRGAETTEHIAELAVVLLVGTTITITGLTEPGLSGWLLVLLLLAVIRPAATALALVPTRLTRRDKMFIGWFGIRGIGSVYYVAVVLNAHALSAAEEQLLYWTVLAGIGTSIIVHGLTSTPASRALRLRRSR
jgi:NhaP-type Na+/H+ or K+/H+ antiporter